MSSFHSEIRTGPIRRFISMFTPEGRARAAAEKKYLKTLAEVKEMLTKTKPVTLMDSAMLPTPALAPLGSGLDVSDLIAARVIPTIAKPTFVFRSGESASAASNELILKSLRTNAFQEVRSAGYSQITERVERAKQSGIVVQARARMDYVDKWTKMLDVQITKIKNSRGIAREDKVRLIQELIDEIRSYPFLEKKEQKETADKKKAELEAYKNDPKQV